MEYNAKTSIGRWVNEAAVLMQRSLVSLFRQGNYNITQEQWIILVNLVEEEGISQSELAGRVDRDNSTVTRVIDNMVKNNLAERRRNRTDRRAHCLYATSKGKELHNKLSAITKMNVDKALEGVSEEELEITIKTLKTMMKNL